MQSSIDQLDSAITEGEAQLKTLEGELEEAQAKVSVQNENLGSRLRTMYKNGTVGFIDVLLDSGSFSEFLNNLNMVEMIYYSDKEVLNGLEKSYDEIDAKKKEVETLQAELNLSLIHIYRRAEHVWRSGRTGPFGKDGLCQHLRHVRGRQGF